MITADTLRRCAYLGTVELESLIQRSYPHDRILQSSFLGISNGGQFCYDITYPGEDGPERSKVFVWLDCNELTADY